MSSSLFTDMSTQRVTFERLRQTLQVRIGATTAQTAELREWYDHALNCMVIEFSADVLAQKIAEDIYKTSFSYKVPNSWWQHFKQDKAPRWFTKRYPVRYDTKHQTRTVRFKRYATYPMSNIALPTHQREVSFAFLGKPEVIKDVVCAE